MGEPVTVTVEDFRKFFPAFADAAKYPDETVQLFLEQALLFVSDRDGCILQLGKVKRKAVVLYAAAHLYALYLNTTDGGSSYGGQGGMAASTTIGSVSVSMIPPPTSNEYYYFWNQTPYGTALMVLLRSRVPCGFYYGGSPQRVLKGQNL